MFKRHSSSLDDFTCEHAGRCCAINVFFNGYSDICRVNCWERPSTLPLRLHLGDWTLRSLETVCSSRSQLSSKRFGVQRFWDASVACHRTGQKIIEKTNRTRLPPPTLGRLGFFLGQRCSRSRSESVELPFQLSRLLLLSRVQPSTVLQSDTDLRWSTRLELLHPRIICVPFPSSNPSNPPVCRPPPSFLRSPPVLFAATTVLPCWGRGSAPLLEAGCQGYERWLGEQQPREPPCYKMGWDERRDGGDEASLSSSLLPTPNRETSSEFHCNSSCISTTPRVAQKILKINNKNGSRKQLNFKRKYMTKRFWHSLGSLSDVYHQSVIGNTFSAFKRLPKWCTGSR